MVGPLAGSDPDNALPVGDWFIIQAVAAY